MSSPAALPHLGTRAYPRLKVATPVRMQVGKNFFVCDTEDISVGGLGARHPSAPPVEAVVRLLFNLPNGSSVNTGAVVRHLDADRFGVEFQELPIGVRAALEDYTRRALGYTRHGRRIAKRLAVTLRSTASGLGEELAETVVLSRNGGRLVCRAHFQVGEELRLYWPGQNRATQVRIVFRRMCGPGGLAELGFEFLSDDDFWQMKALS